MNIDSKKGKKHHNKSEFNDLAFRTAVGTVFHVAPCGKMSAFVRKMNEKIDLVAGNDEVEVVDSFFRIANEKSQISIGNFGTFDKKSSQDVRIDSVLIANNERLPPLLVWNQKAIGESTDLQWKEWFDVNPSAKNETFLFGNLLVIIRPESTMTTNDWNFPFTIQTKSFRLSSLMKEKVHTPDDMNPLITNHKLYLCALIIKENEEEENEKQKTQRNTKQKKGKKGKKGEKGDKGEEDQIVYSVLFHEDVFTIKKQQTRLEHSSWWKIGKINKEGRLFKISATSHQTKIWDGVKKNALVLFYTTLPQDQNDVNPGKKISNIVKNLTLSTKVNQLKLVPPAYSRNSCAVDCALVALWNTKTDFWQTTLKAGFIFWNELLKKDTRQKKTSPQRNCNAVLFEALAKTTEILRGEKPITQKQKLKWITNINRTLKMHCQSSAIALQFYDGNFQDFNIFLRYLIDDIFYIQYHGIYQKISTVNNKFSKLVFQSPLFEIMIGGKNSNGIPWADENGAIEAFQIDAQKKRVDSKNYKDLNLEAILKFSDLDIKQNLKNDAQERQTAVFPWKMSFFGIAISRRYFDEDHGRESIYRRSVVLEPTLQLPALKSDKKEKSLSGTLLLLTAIIGQINENHFICWFLHKNHWYRYDDIPSKKPKKSQKAKVHRLEIEITKKSKDGITHPHWTSVTWDTVVQEASRKCVFLCYSSEFDKFLSSFDHLFEPSKVKELVKHLTMDSQFVFPPPLNINLS